MKHGHRKNGYSLTYSSWHNMIARCARSRSCDDGLYFDRGVTVCARWKGRDGFQNFLSDMGERPGKKFSIGRAPNALEYSPENCSWQTRGEQNSCGGYGHRLATVRGETRSLAEWAECLCIQYKSLLQRLRRGWTEEEACSCKKGKRKGM